MLQMHHLPIKLHHCCWINLFLLEAIKLSPDRLVIYHKMCTILFLVSHMTAFPASRARYLYALLRGDYIDLSKHFISHILEMHRETHKKIKLPFGCLIQHLVSYIEDSLFEEPPFKLAQPINATIFHQSKSHGVKSGHTPKNISSDNVDDHGVKSEKICPFYRTTNHVSTIILCDHYGTIVRTSSPTIDSSTSVNSLLSHSGYRPEPKLDDLQAAVQGC
ncbi:hypothetical protein Nepgr_018491 [Nepenthes gracilis]|uniref:Uncharacterized protein n=1 Tax=Nepenthes gracilis TaxID=150966 RepID=A0AAD3XUB5_NEPGR|nr:hypothetical protein Nepgr_018491 [Nepenthes gracilis]